MSQYVFRTTNYLRKSIFLDHLKMYGSVIRTSKRSLDVVHWNVFSRNLVERLDKCLMDQSRLEFRR